MSDYFSKLGEMLKDVLDEGKIPEPVIKVEKDNSEKTEQYKQEFENLSIQVQKAIKYLKLTYPFTLEEFNHQYHELLKAVHPDTSKPDDSNTNNKQFEINEIQKAYKTIKTELFQIK